MTKRTHFSSKSNILSLICPINKREWHLHLPYHRGIDNRQKRSFQSLVEAILNRPHTGASLNLIEQIWKKFTLTWDKNKFTKSAAICDSYSSKIIMTVKILNQVLHMHIIPDFNNCWQERSCKSGICLKVNEIYFLIVHCLLIEQCLQRHYCLV